MLAIPVILPCAQVTVPGQRRRARADMTTFEKAGQRPGGPPGSDRGDFRAVSDIHETALPGVGVRYELSTRVGVRLGVVSHRHGRRDLLVYDGADPDAARESVRLTEAESRALASLLRDRKSVV